MCGKRIDEMEREEIRAYKEELRRYLDEIPDDLFYAYFHIRPMGGDEYDRISRDLLDRGYIHLLARFAERKNPRLKDKGLTREALNGILKG